MGACPSAIRIYSIYTIFVWRSESDVAKSLVNRGWHGFCYLLIWTCGVLSPSPVIMARYKNVTRTASVQWAVRFWWNMVRNFDELVFDSDFFDIIAYNLDRDEVAAVIGGNIDAKELKPLTEAKDEKRELDRDCTGFMLKRIWNWKPLRKKCRAVLKILRDRLLRKLEPCEEDARFERRFKRLCRFFRLDAVEADLLKLVYALHATLFDDFPLDVSVADRPLYFAMTIDRSFGEVTAALSKKGRLFRYNCIDEAYNFNFKELGGYFEGMEAVPLDARYYRADVAEALPWEFYGKLADEAGAVLREMPAGGSTSSSTACRGLARRASRARSRRLRGSSPTSCSRASRMGGTSRPPRASRASRSSTSAWRRAARCLSWTSRTSFSARAACSRGNASARGPRRA